MTRLALILLAATACSGSAPAPEARPAPRTEQAPEPPLSPEDDAAWTRCHEIIEGRCAAAHPAGGEPELACRRKARDRYEQIKTSQARKEYLLVLGCPATAAEPEP